MAQRVTMDANRGIRMTQDRLLSDLTPCPGYAVGWTVAFHDDMMTGGALNISKEDAKYLLDLLVDKLQHFSRSEGLYLGSVQIYAVLRRLGKG